MKYTDLHIHLLEQKYGSISAKIINEKESFRSVYLIDAHGHPKTFSSVKFYPVEDSMLKNAHEEIVNGGLLGKTLIKNKIEFEKKLYYSNTIKLPAWLKEGFKTDANLGWLNYSQIFYLDKTYSIRLYASIIEVCHPELNMYMPKSNESSEFDNSDFLILLKLTGLNAM